MLPPAYHSENILNVVSLKGFTPQDIGITILNLRIIFRGKPWKEIFRCELNLSLSEWENEEERMNGNE